MRPIRHTSVNLLWLRKVIRQPFNVACAHIDDQYENDDKVYHVTETDLLCGTCNDPGDCAFWSY